MLSKYNLESRKLLIITLKRYGISQLLKDRFVEFGYFDENIEVLDSEETPREVYKKSDFYISEGNVFELLSLVKACGINKHIKEVLKMDSIYMGSSAGAAIASRDIIFANDLDKNTIALQDLDALNLVKDCAIIPHYTKKELKRFLDNSPGLEEKYRKIYSISNKGILVFE